MPTATKPQVVIVGGGPAGLALAIELGHRNVPCLLVEKTERGGYAPRAARTYAEVTRVVNGDMVTVNVPVTTPIRPGDTIVVKERYF